jgi:acyl-CoA synthetase (AMP-forming)/AMP-acid ligase II
MLGQFLATFAGVILSFLLWFGGERIIRHQREKKARAHLREEIVDELKGNITILNSFTDLLERELKKGKISLVGLKLNASAMSAAISSGELRLISDSEQRRLIRISADMCREFNHVIENAELFLAILNVKSQSEALPQAKQRLNALKELAGKSADFLQDIVDKLTSPKK